MSRFLKIKLASYLATTTEQDRGAASQVEFYICFAKEDCLSERPESTLPGVPIMHTLSSTSRPTTLPSYASCVVMSSNSLTAPIRCAGGAVAMGTWATSPRSTSSLFTTANDLMCQSKMEPFPQVLQRAVLTPSLTLLPCSALAH
ncbi:GRB2 related adaptor protein a isoform X2 [Lates japonicus]|uniref:GRB2 related adaptor protein a isoform X2 n=1 Tax=Lates japonicus TaxID=270547 RepID=A0AAD3MUA8_LATJO|nr:GRB2 related adaptor protein a isoform X2 [Lates japonicus]